MRLGLEYELVFIDENGEYLDCENSEYSEFMQVVDAFPLYPDDARYLGCKSLESRPKRCYVEGFERRDENGNLRDTLPKALELRTLPHESLPDLVDEFRASFRELVALTDAKGWEPALVSRHPFKSELDLGPRLKEVDLATRSKADFELASRAMMTSGIHINVSLDNPSADAYEDLLQKVNYYVPALIVWSFSSPFYQGEAFKGPCSRNFLRARKRSMADLRQRVDGQVLEFRGFDGCGDHDLMTALLELYAGFIEDQALEGRSAIQRAGAIEKSCISGFDDPELAREGQALIEAAWSTGRLSAGSKALLERSLQANDHYAARMKSCYDQGQSITDCITGRFRY